MISGTHREMFSEGDDTAECPFGKIVNGRLAVVELAVWNTLEVRIDEALHLIKTLSDGFRCDLFIVADYDVFVAKKKGSECSHIALTGLINDDHIKTRLAWVEAFIHTAQRHDPHGHRSPCDGEQRASLPKQVRNALAGAFTDLPHRLHIAHQCRGLQRSPFALRGPRLELDDLSRRLSQFIPDGLQPILQV